MLHKDIISRRRSYYKGFVALRFTYFEIKLFFYLGVKAPARYAPAQRHGDGAGVPGAEQLPAGLPHAAVLQDAAAQPRHAAQVHTP